MTSDDAPVLIDENAAVATLTLNRPDARNSLSMAMMKQLRDHVQALADASPVRVIVLAANGPVFCAGHDLKEITAARDAPDGGHAFVQETVAACCALMQAIVACPKPVIAAVQGMATAAGCQLVATCDLAIASRQAKFATPGVNIGLFCSTPMVALSRNVPRKAAMQMLLTGEPISAIDAQAIGLINRVVEAPALMEEVWTLANTIATKAPAIVKIGKEAFYAQSEMSLARAYDYTARVMVTNMMMADAQEGIGAFLEKRPANWYRPADPL